MAKGSAGRSQGAAPAAGRMPPNGTRDGYLEFEAPIVELEAKIEELWTFSKSTDVDLTNEIDELTRRCEEKKRVIFSKLTPWQKVQLARHPQRPVTEEYVNLIVEDWIELHGDRSFRDDPAIVTGLGRIGGVRAMLVGQRKGKATRDRVRCNFGCPHPEGYRKALHKMQFAAKFRLPVVTLINTPGAHPGVGAEERGQAFAIAKNLMEMAALPTPIVCVVIGEGGSGGALGIGVGDRILMLEHAYYSVISPEGCAAILWKSAEFAETAASTLRLTAQDLAGLGVVDEILPEPLGGAHRDHAVMAATLREAILRHLDALAGKPVEDLLRERYEKFRRIGAYLEAEA